MKLKSLNALSLVTLVLISTACRYSNEFSGTFNQKPATLTAFSKNTDKYCIALNLTNGTETRQSYISAKSVFDDSDLTRPKLFNTKNEPCSANLEEYLVGLRTTKILGTSVTARNEILSGYLCQMVYYTQYTYADEIQFDFKNKLSDEITGSFSGTGQAQLYIDYSRPVGYGPVYRCSGNYPYPGPFPGPYPRPFPRRGLPGGR